MTSTPPNRILMWETTDNIGIKATCEYFNGTYTVTVSKDEKSYSEDFGQTFTPTFGMDVIDQARSVKIAEQLADRIQTI